MNEILYDKMVESRSYVLFGSQLDFLLCNFEILKVLACNLLDTF